MQQSELALFTEGFHRALAPLQASVAVARASLCDATRGPDLAFDPDELDSGLVSLAAELRTLDERIARERATVFVFGPAKSGKSTLVDALAAVRVSEVSILPGYPGLLRARHAADESAALQRFDGSTELLADPAALRLVLQRTHGELAARVREVRAAGEAFDPARHLQRAVRRVERAQPCEPLARAALELVECPPVHGPLFPTYSSMLIGEPDHARAAVFVVRAAQLADDVAFDGIEELLASFDSLLLVLNLDERSREISRAGELVASTEREDPSRLIAAFEELTPCEPLARALRSGKVPVLALDLLEAARSRLHGTEEDAQPARQRTRFGDLERELATVLDGHDALRVLAHSGLRRARELAVELRELGATPGLSELAPRRDATRGERAALATAQRALERLLAREHASWEAEELFDGLGARTAERAAARARELAAELEGPLARAIEDWFADGTSLAELMRARLEPRLAAACLDVARTAERGLREELRVVRDGLSASARADISEARIDLAPVLTACAERLRIELEPAALRALDVEAIPVRAKLGERVRFRAPAAVRDALLGPPEAPDRPLSSAAKTQRLGTDARGVLQQSVAERAHAILGDEARRSARALGQALLAAFDEELRACLERERARLEQPACALDVRVTQLDALAAACGALPAACARAENELAQLAERFDGTDVLVPAPREPRERRTLAHEPPVAGRRVP